MSGLFSQNPSATDCSNYIKIIDKTNYSEKSNSVIKLHPLCVDILSKNFRDTYKELSTKINKDGFYFEHKNCENRIYSFSNTAITNIGIIITDKKYYFNGGCYKEYNINTIKLFQYRNFLKKNSKIYDNVISIAELWGDKIWHFPLEAIVALKNIPNLKNTYLHITKKTEFCLNWIEFLKIPIEKDKIIDGDIFAKNLIIPEMGNCGEPNYDLTLWLQNRIYRCIPQSFDHNYMILIKRNFKRIVKNNDELTSICKKFSEKLKLKLYIHDDFLLPPLINQMSIFHKAKIIIAPHGAGSVNLLACKPNSIFLEFLPISQELINTCYIKLANYLNIHYYGIPYQTNNNVEIELVENQFKLIEKHFQ